VEGRRRVRARGLTPLSSRGTVTGAAGQPKGATPNTKSNPSSPAGGAPAAPTPTPAGWHSSPGPPPEESSARHAGSRRPGRPRTRPWKAGSPSAGRAAAAPATLPRPPARCEVRRRVARQGCGRSPRGTGARHRPTALVPLSMRSTAKQSVEPKQRKPPAPGDEPMHDLVQLCDCSSKRQVIGRGDRLWD
jgi:hypothetical protein